MKKIVWIFIIALALCLVFASATAEKVLVDNNKVSIIVKSMETSGDKFEMKVYLENKTNVTAMFAIRDTVINGYVADPYWATPIAPGKKKNDTITVYSLSDRGISDVVSEIKFVMRVYDSDDWSAPDIFNEKFALYPVGKKKAAIVEREAQPKDLVIVNNSKVSIVVTGFDEDPSRGYTAHLYITNKTKKSLMFATVDVSVNGYMIDPFWAEELPPKSRCYTDMNWRSSGLEENDIKKVKDIEITFRVYDSNNWSAPDVFKKALTIRPW